MGREADTCSLDWIRRPDNLISCDVPIITTAFEQRQVAGSWEWGQILGPAFQNRAPRLEEGRCVSEMKLSACISFTFAPAEMYNYSHGPLSRIPLSHNSSSLRPACSLHLLLCLTCWRLLQFSIHAIVTGNNKKAATVLSELCGAPLYDWNRQHYTLYRLLFFES